MKNGLWFTRSFNISPSMICWLLGKQLCSVGSLRKESFGPCATCSTSFFWYQWMGSKSQVEKVGFYEMMSMSSCFFSPIGIKDPNETGVLVLREALPRIFQAVVCRKVDHENDSSSRPVQTHLIRIFKYSHVHAIDFTARLNQISSSPIPRSGETKNQNNKV